jgi:ADP-ribose pyrophosphatase YjhB (NUDIX family)
VDPKSFWGQSNRLGISPYLRKAYVGIEDKREVILQILAENQLDAAETIFVGDMVHDVETARKGGITSCAVLTGFDPESKLTPTKPDYLLRDLRELRLILEASILSMQEQPIVTVGALILNPAHQCLMVKTRKWNDKWGIPGGKIQRGEKAEVALEREILEETNLPLKNIRFAMVQDCIESEEFYRSVHFILLNYIAECDGSAVRLNDEAQEWQWVDPKSGLKLDINRPTRLLLEHYLQGQ